MELIKYPFQTNITFSDIYQKSQVLYTGYLDITKYKPNIGIFNKFISIDDRTYTGIITSNDENITYKYFFIWENVDDLIDYEIELVLNNSKNSNSIKIYLNYISLYDENIAREIFSVLKPNEKLFINRLVYSHQIFIRKDNNILTNNFWIVSID